MKVAKSYSYLLLVNQNINKMGSLFDNNLGLSVKRYLTPEIYVPPTKKMPIVGIQIWNNVPVDLIASKVFELPFVIPYIEIFFSYSNGDGRSMLDRAKDVVQSVKDVHIKFVATHPNTPFRWGWWPHRYGEGIDSPDTNLFTHKDDKLVTGEHAIFTAKGRAFYKAKTREFMSYLAPMLAAANLPPPIFVDPDYEGGAWLAGADWTKKHEWHTWLKSDPRSQTELIDGYHTYSQLSKNLKDMNGNVIPESELYSHPYDSSKWNLSCVYSTYNAAIVDWALHDALYSVVKEYWPDCICGNWGTFGATPEKLVHNYRFKESPVQVGSGFHGDIQIATLYGNYTTDTLNQPLGLGYNTFYEQLQRFGIDQTKYPNKNDLARKIHVENMRYYVEGMKAANSKKLGFSMTWRGAGIWTGKDVYTSPQHYPSSYIGAELDYNASPNMIKEIFDIFKDNNVKIVEIFAQGATKAGLDKMYDVLRLLE